MVRTPSWSFIDNNNDSHSCIKSRLLPSFSLEDESACTIVLRILVKCLLKTSTAAQEHNLHKA